MRKLFTFAIGFGLAAAANAQIVTGPAYPPPGGVTYSPSGSIINGTQTRNYTSFDLSQSGQLYYGASALGLAMDNSIDATSERLVYDVSQSNLAAGIAKFTGKTTIYTTTGAKVVDTLFTLQVTDMSGGALSLTTNPDISLNGSIDPVLLVTGDFKALLTMQAAYDPASPGSYQSAASLFNSASKTGPSDTSGGQTPLRNDIGTGFWSTPAAVPEPATWTMMIIGFGAVGFTLRRRQAKAIAA